MKTSRTLWISLLVLPLAAGCESDSSDSGGGDGGAIGSAGTGGSTDTGGTTSTGGSTDTGGAAGSGGSGGSTDTGGTSGSAGSTETGGAAGSGGSTDTGGTSGSAGSTDTGGTAGSGGSGGDEAPPTTVAGFGVSACAALGAVPGDATVVGPGDDVADAIALASPGDTVALQDGTYSVPSGGYRFDTNGVTLRSVSGNPEAVILDGQWGADEILRMYASDVTIGELTLTQAVHHLAHVSSGTEGVNSTGNRFYRVRFIDGGQQFLKANSSFDYSTWADRGVVECSDFVMTDSGREHVSDCYTGGIDTHGGRDWIVRNDYFEGIWCEVGIAEHAVHFWSRARDTLVENNLIINCARGIGFGLGSEPSGGGRDYADADPSWSTLQHVGGIARNNVIWSTNHRYDTGIEIQRTLGARVLHNTVLSREASATGRYSSIDYRYASTTVDLVNNLVWRITVRDGGQASLDGNIEGADETWLEDVDGGNFHLRETATTAIDSGVADADGGVDIDGEPHTNGAPDVGADER